MKIAYCSLLLPEEKKLSERTRGRLPGVSLHKFTRALIKGIDENLNEPIKVFNIINTLNYPNFPDLVFKTEKWSHAKGSEDWHIGYINLFGIKYITQANGLYKKLKAFVKQNKDEQTVIIVHHIFYPAMKAAVKIKKRFKDKVKLVFITGDMNGSFGLSSQFKKNLKSRLLKNIEKAVDRMVLDFDGYVFATKDMAKAYGVEDKPFTVVECAYTEAEYHDESKDNSFNPENKKVIFYAGSMRTEYGIPHLLRAFSLIDKPNYELWLAGGGSAENMVREYAAKDSRIKYLGFIPPKEVYLREKNSTVLISPRTTELEFVKYSFPSKSMEGLASGKPYIAHKLPCDPPEYNGPIIYAENESDEAFAKKIVEICELSDQQREEIGKKAREFVLTQKNPKTMCKKITELFKELYR